MGTDDGQNLLDPGKTPHENAQFLIFLTAIIKGVDQYADILRVSAASHGNDHRLGAAEAPPAIISIFLGDQLQDIFDQIEHGEATSSLQGGKMRVGVNTLPYLNRDAQTETELLLWRLPGINSNSVCRLLPALFLAPTLYSIPS